VLSSYPTRTVSSDGLQALKQRHWAKPRRTRKPITDPEGACTAQRRARQGSRGAGGEVGGGAWAGTEANG